MIKEIRYWVQKVLPLVYDDSLSYYELLAKIVDKLNETIKLVNTSTENVYSIVSDILNEWLEDGTLENLVSGAVDDLREDFNELSQETDEKIDELTGEFEQFQTDIETEVSGEIDELKRKAVVGNFATYEQVWSTYYPYPTSTGARTDVCAGGRGNYAYQGFCVTPNGFAVVRYAPEENKINDNDISQIFEFSRTGQFIRSKGVDVHHGNSMLYYDGYLYVYISESATVAKIRYSDLVIDSSFNFTGSGIAIDRAHDCFYSYWNTTKRLYRYDLLTGTMTDTAVLNDPSDGFNGAFIKDGIYYYFTFNHNLCAIDIASSTFLGGIALDKTDTTGILPYECEDADVDEDGNIYFNSQQPGFRTTVYTTSHSSATLSLTNDGLYVGKLFLYGGSSMPMETHKPDRIHASDIFVVSASTEYDAMNGRYQVGTDNAPFYSFWACNYYYTDVRVIDASGYTTMFFGDCYAPSRCSAYLQLNSLTISTTYPFGFKGVRGYMNGGSITATDYVAFFAFGEMKNINISTDNETDTVVASLGYVTAEILAPANTNKMYARVNKSVLNGRNIIPIGSCKTNGILYTNQGFSNGASASVTGPVVDSTGATVITFISSSKNVMYVRVGNTLVGSDGSTLSLSGYSTSTGTFTFTAPYAVTYITFK